VGVVRSDDGREIVVKENDGGRWSSDGVVLWLGRKQNRDAVGWWGRIVKVEMIFLYQWRV
jgi:hypothetical protein